MKRFILGLVALLLTGLQAEAADHFWVGGPGDWSDAANHWANASGGAPGSGSNLKAINM